LKTIFRNWDRRVGLRRHIPDVINKMPIVILKSVLNRRMKLMRYLNAMLSFVICVLLKRGLVSQSPDQSDRKENMNVFKQTYAVTVGSAVEWLQIEVNAKNW